MTSLRWALTTVGYAGHSFQSGAVATATQCGIQDLLIKTLGRWESSDCIRNIRTTVLFKYSAQIHTCMHVGRMFVLWLSNIRYYPLDTILLGEKRELVQTLVRLSPTQTIRLKGWDLSLGIVEYPSNSSPPSRMLFSIKEECSKLVQVLHASGSYILQVHDVLLDRCYLTAVWSKKSLKYFLPHCL